MPNPGDLAPWRRLRNATRYSLQGLRACYRHEQAFRQEVGVLLLALPLGAWFGETGVERVLLIGSWLVVLIVELLNSAIESVVDRIGDEPHKLSGRAKDMGSAAVFLSLMLVLVLWGTIAVSRFFPGLIPY